MKNKVFSATRLDEDELSQPSNGFFYMYNDTDVINDVDAYIDGPIEHHSKYRHLLQYMRKMKEHDSLTLWVSSPGGYMDTAMQIIEGMNNTKGQVLVNVVGAASSAAGMIALAAPQLIVSDQAYMLCHAASYGIEGKQGDVESMVLFNQHLLKNTIRSIYRGFLTEQEIEEMLMGRDFWFDSAQMQERLEKRQVMIQAEIDGLLDEQDAGIRKK